MSGDRRVRSLADALGLGLVSWGIGLVASLGRSKVAAVVLGPTGFGVIAELQNAVSLAFVPNTLAAGPALVKGLARTERTADHDEARAIYRTAFAIALLGALIGLPLAMAVTWVSLPEHRTAASMGLVIVASLAAALGTQRTLQRQVLIATGLLKDLTVADAILPLLSLTCVVTGLLTLGLTGHFVGNAVALAAILPLLAWLLRRTPHPERWRGIGLALHRPFVRETISIGSATLITGLLSQGCLLAIRSLLAEHGGSAWNGLFHACWAITHLQFATLLRSMGNFVLPRYAAAAGPDELRREIDTAWRFVLRILPPGILLLLALRVQVLELLFSDAFRAAAPALGLMLVADLSKGMSWSVGSALLIRGHATVFTLVQGATWGIFLGLSLLWVPTRGIEGAGLAFLICTVASLFLNQVAVWWTCGVAPRRTDVLVGLALPAAGLGAGWVATLGVAGQLAVVAVAGLWAVRAQLPQAAWNRLQRLRGGNP